MKSSPCSCLSTKHMRIGIRTGFLISLALDHEDYLAQFVEMNGRGLAMCTAFPSFAMDGFVVGFETGFTDLSEKPVMGNNRRLFSKHLGQPVILQTDLNQVIEMVQNILGSFRQYICPILALN